MFSAAFDKPVYGEGKILPAPRAPYHICVTYTQLHHPDLPGVAVMLCQSGAFDRKR